MYLEYWNLKEKPFENTPDPKFLYASAAHEEALTRMSYCIEENRGAAMLTGEYGSGKTLLTRALLKKLLQEGNKYKVALIVNPSFASNDFLREIIFQFDSVLLKGTKLKLIHSLNELLYRSMNEGKKTVVIVDEAQAIKSRSMFEELRLLLNFQMNDKFLLTLLLVGQPELIRKIDRLPQFKQRLATTYHLTGFGEEDVAKYIDYRCRVAGGDSELFSPATVKMITKGTRGIPRSINTMCELSLLQGMFEEKKVIDEDVVGKVLEEVYI
ncbi:MAG: AAA family ATPase [Candidatus Omnitrophica bacterium]|nr:AAA family ATPase [Candidatus Omnitrophota bacterium]MDD5429291.1 AAA family ATPase [Candidatus Omnitrophota bacterium]